MMTTIVSRCALVGIGGMVGSLVRYGFTILFQNIPSFPFGTLVSNIGGCFLIGAVSALSINVPVLTMETRLFLATGFCGGFTTLSSFIYEMSRFLREKEYALGILYCGGTLAGASLAFFLGVVCVKVLYGMKSAL